VGSRPAGLRTKRVISDIVKRRSFRVSTPSKDSGGTHSRRLPWSQDRDGRYVGSCLTAGAVGSILQAGLSSQCPCASNSRSRRPYAECGWALIMRAIK
jgi:hypothetical protein